MLNILISEVVLIYMKCFIQYNISDVIHVERIESATELILKIPI